MHNFITDLGTLYVCLNNPWSKVGLTRAFFLFRNRSIYNIKSNIYIFKMKITEKITTTPLAFAALGFANLMEEDQM